MLLEGRVCSDVAHFLCSCPEKCHLRPYPIGALIVLGYIPWPFYWNLAAVSVSSVGVHSPFVSFSQLETALIAGAVMVPLLSCVLGVGQQGAFHSLHCQSPQHPPLHSPHFPGGLHLLESQSDFVTALGT